MKLIALIFSVAFLVSCASSPLPELNPSANPNREVAEVVGIPLAPPQPLPINRNMFNKGVTPTIVENGTYKCGDMTITVTPDMVKLNDEVAAPRKVQNACDGWTTLDAETKFKLMERRNTLTVIVENDLYDTNSVIQTSLKKKNGYYFMDMLSMSTDDYGDQNSKSTSVTQRCTKTQ